MGRRHLVLKGRTWWFHRDIPEALRASFDGRKTITINLHTGDIRQAQGRRTQALLETERDFRAAAKAGTPKGPLHGIAEDAKTWAEERKLYEADPVAWADSTNASFEEALEDRADTILRKHGKDAYELFGAIVYGDDPIATNLEDHLRSSGLPMRSVQERRTAVTKVAEWRPKLTLRTLTRKVAGEYVRAMEEAGTHPKTGNKTLSNIRQYWKWMVKRGLAEENPWLEQTIDGRAIQKTFKKERPFTEGEIKKLLYSPYPVGWSHKDRLHDAMRIAALSGMRIEEICRLTVADCQNGMFDIRRAKTEAGVRRVPIHPDLRGIVRTRCKGKASASFLFNDIDKKGTTGERSMPLSKQFTRYREALGIDPRGAESQRRALVNFHSFRRWFATMAERAGQMTNVMAAVMGHARLGETLAYSGGPSVEKQMRACVEAVKLPAR